MASIYLRDENAAVPARFVNEIVLTTEAPDATLSLNLSGIESTVGVLPPEAATLLRLAATTYCADKLVLRWGAADKWSRDIKLCVHANDLRLWQEAAVSFERALRFLTQDRWTIEFEALNNATGAAAQSGRFDAVSLFSGGLDSLVGVIDLLEGDGHLRLLLVGHHDANSTETAQERIFGVLAKHYGERVSFLPLLARPSRRRGAQYQLPATRENTTRSRSFLFIAAAVAAAAASGPGVPIYVPENGFIAINVPLGEDRVGSCSTRTTHPRYLDLLSMALAAANICNPIRNPYLYTTKGEMLAQCRNHDLLVRLEKKSVSCSHPDARRYDQHNDRENCGYCYPCIIRRASLHRVGRDRPADYRYDICRADRGLVVARQLRKSARGQDPRAVLSSLADPPGAFDVLRAGPLPASVSLDQLSDMHRRGRDELRELFRAKGTRDIRQYAGL